MPADAIWRGACIRSARGDHRAPPAALSVFAVDMGGNFFGLYDSKVNFDHIPSAARPRHRRH